MAESFEKGSDTRPARLLDAGIEVARLDEDLRRDSAVVRTTRRWKSKPAPGLMNRANTVMHKNTVPTDVTEATVVGPDFVVLGAVDLHRGAIADIAVSTDGSTIVATHYGSGSISVIDADAMATGTAIDIPVEPFLVTAAE